MTASYWHLLLAVVSLCAPGDTRKFTLPAAIEDPGLYMAMLFCGFALACYEKTITCE